MLTCECEKGSVSLPASVIVSGTWVNGERTTTRETRERLNPKEKLSIKVGLGRKGVSSIIRQEGRKESLAFSFSPKYTNN